MTTNSLAIFVSDLNQIELVDTAQKTYDFYDDIFIVSDKALFMYNVSIIPLYYIKFFKGDIVFLAVDDYLKYRDYFTPEQTCLITKKDQEGIYNIDFNKIKLKKVLYI